MILNYPITSDLLSELAIWSTTLRAALKNHSLTLLQYRILNSLYQHGWNLNSNALADSLRISPGSMTSALNRLESMNLLLRKESSNDRRCIEVVLMPQGQDLIHKAHVVVSKAEAKHFEPWGRFLNKKLNTIADEIFVNNNQLDAQLLTGASEISHYTDAVLLTGDAVTKQLKAKGLSMTEFRMLFEMREHQDGMHINQLAHQLLLLMPDVSTAANKLVQKGLLLRSIDKQDRRARLLEINSAGFAVMAYIAEQVDGLLCDFVPNSSAEERKLFLKSSKILADYKRRNF